MITSLRLLLNSTHYTTLMTRVATASPRGAHPTGDAWFPMTDTTVSVPFPASSTVSPARRALEREAQGAPAVRLPKEVPTFGDTTER